MIAYLHAGTYWNNIWLTQNLSPGHIRHPSAMWSVCGRKPWRSQHHRAGASRSWPQPYRSWGPKSVVVDRREVCEHVRKTVYGPRPSYGHLLTESLTHSDFQGCAALALILESASRHSLKKWMLVLFYKDREPTWRPPQGLFKVAVQRG